MAVKTVEISQIDNGFIVTILPTAGSPQVEQYCADKNAVATFLVQTMVPGATFTPAPPPAP